MLMIVFNLFETLMGLFFVLVLSICSLLSIKNIEEEGEEELAVIVNKHFQISANGLITMCDNTNVDYRVGYKARPL